MNVLRCVLLRAKTEKRDMEIFPVGSIIHFTAIQLVRTLESDSHNRPAELKCTPVQNLSSHSQLLID